LAQGTNKHLLLSGCTVPPSAMASADDDATKTEEEKLPAGEDEPAAEKEVVAEEPATAPSSATGSSAAARGKAARVKAPPPESGGGLGMCLLWTIFISLGVFMIGVLLYVLGAPLPWGLIGLGPPKHEISSAAWEEATLGKTVFVKFFAPWCGHCKRMKPDWDKLAKEYSNSSTIMVASVDCIGAGKALCNLAGVKGFPSIKYGDPSDIKGLDDYKGQRTYKSLADFAAKLDPPCGPAQLEHCSEEQKAKIVEFTAMTIEERQALIDDKVGTIERHEAAFKEVTDGFTKQYKEASDVKNKKVKEIREPLDLLRAVQKFSADPGGSADSKTAEL